MWHNRQVFQETFLGFEPYSRTLCCFLLILSYFSNCLSPYKWILTNLILGVILGWKSIASRGGEGRNTHSRFMPQKAQIHVSAGLMAHSSCLVLNTDLTFCFPCTVCIFSQMSVEQCSTVGRTFSDLRRIAVLSPAGGKGWSSGKKEAGSCSLHSIVKVNLTSPPLPSSY